MNATMETILAITFTLLVTVIPFVILTMAFPAWTGAHVTELGRWLDGTLLRGLQAVGGR